MDKSKIFFIVMIFMVIAARGQAIDLKIKSIIINENLREEIVFMNYYIEKLKEKKTLKKDPIFIRISAGNAASGEVINFRFMGHYYRNTTGKEEYYFEFTKDLIYVFDTASVSYLKNMINFSLLKSNKKLENYGNPKLGIDGAIHELGEISFDVECGKLHLALVTGLPSTDIYYNIKFSILRGTVL